MRQYMRDKSLLLVSLLNDLYHLIMAEGPPPVHALCSAEEPEEIQKRSAFGSR